MRHTLLLLISGAAIGLLALGCRQQPEPPAVRTIKIEPIHIQTDIRVRIENDECATSQPVQKDAR